jgi:hypothetical protein
MTRRDYQGDSSQQFLDTDRTNDWTGSRRERRMT